MSCVVRWCDVSVMRFQGKPVFHVTKKRSGFHSQICGAETKHVENKVFT